MSFREDFSDIDKIVEDILERSLSYREKFSDLKGPITIDDCWFLDRLLDNEDEREDSAPNIHTKFVYEYLWFFRFTKEAKEKIEKQGYDTDFFKHFSWGLHDVKIFLKTLEYHDFSHYPADQIRTLPLNIKDKKFRIGSSDTEGNIKRGIGLIYSHFDQKTFSIFMEEDKFLRYCYESLVKNDSIPREYLELFKSILCP